MRVDLYTIETLTNLHVGSGEVNFDIVDNQVQRDAVTGIPVIHSSSLKGAFREHFENKENNTLLVKYIFGGANNEDNAQAGAYNFFEAQLLTRPVRSNKKAYFNATTPTIIGEFCKTIDDLGIDFDEELKKELENFSKLKVNDETTLIFENIDGVSLEDLQATYNNFNIEKISEFLGKDLALLSDKNFKELSLPVIARNHLDNGVSKNLWYEEVVPKKSKFYFCIAKPTNLDEKDKEQKIDGFERKFDREGSNLQIGGNKSIGYGFTKIKRVSK